MRERESICYPFSPCAVYLLKLNSEVIYIGSSTNVFARLAKHSSKKEFDQVDIIWSKESEMSALEKSLIEKLKPKRNIYLTGIKVKRDRKQRSNSIARTRKDSRWLQYD